MQPNLTTADVRDGMTPQRIAEFDRRMRAGVLGDTRIQRIKIFDAQPRMIWSDRHELIGDSAAGVEGVRHALAGEVVSHFVHGVDHKDKGARTLEVYVPLRFQRRRRARSACMRSTSRTRRSRRRSRLTRARCTA